VSENDTLGSFIDGLFTSRAMFYQNREIFPSAVAHDRDAVLIMMSSRGRLFNIPREIKDVAKSMHLYLKICAEHQESGVTKSNRSPGFGREKD